MKQYKQLTSEQRYQIYGLKQAGLKQSQIERQLALPGWDAPRPPLHAFRGKLLVLNVWATWCPPCRREMPSLERLSKSVDGSRIVVAGQSAGSGANAGRE